LKLLHMPILRYVDDYFSVDTAENVEHGLRCFTRVIRAIMGTGSLAERKLEFGRELIILGVDTSLASPGLLSLAPAEKKRAKWLASIESFLADDKLLAADAAVLAGRLSWTTSVCFMRLGRSMLRPIFAQQFAQLRGGVLSPTLIIALCWWQRVLSESIAITIQLSAPQPPVVDLFADAEGCPPRIAGVAFGGCGVIAYACFLPRAVLAALQSRNDEQIMAQELIAILVALYTFPDAFAGKRLRIWTDNVGGECALKASRAKCQDHNMLVHAIWARLIELRTPVWFERVPSKVGPLICAFRATLD